MMAIDKNYTFILVCHFEGYETPISIRVRKRETERFQDFLEKLNECSTSPNFFTCDTLDGTRVGLNLLHIQALSLCWEPSAFPEEEKFREGPMKLLFKGRAGFIESHISESENLSAFFEHLEMFPDTGLRFDSFEDEDGELFYANLKDLSLIEAPKAFLQSSAEAPPPF